MKAMQSWNIVIYFEMELISIFGYTCKIKCTIICVSVLVIKNSNNTRATFAHMKNQMIPFNNKSLHQWKQSVVTLKTWNSVIICLPVSKGNFTRKKFNYCVNVDFQVLTLYALMNDIIIGGSCMKGKQELSVLILQTLVYIQPVQSTEKL